MKLYNSLSRHIEEFKPLSPPAVSMYTCGPTVYHYATIGNFRTYTNADLLLRTLQFQGYDVTYVMNITDVGHLTGDNEGDADTGEDRMERSAKREGRTVWDIANYYTDAFLKDYDKLNLIKPQHLVKATDHIQEQIDLIKTLEEKGYTYQTSDGIYFDTEKFPTYGELSSLDEIKEGARVEVNPEKKNSRDFALWKFSPTDEKRQMEWESPWGVGFPGWHIECSAMSMKYLGESFDIHAGGMDLKETHHPNEIAQSEAATGKKFVNYWFHSAFVLVNGEKMSKSKGNVYRVEDLEQKGYNPLALRYLYLQTQYRQEMNFTFDSLDAAKNALERLYNIVATLEAGGAVAKEYEERFLAALNDDLNMPQALAVLWEVTKADLTLSDKLATLIRFDTVLGLGIEHYFQASKAAASAIPEEVMALIHERDQARAEKNFQRSDELRSLLSERGYDVIDTPEGTQLRKRLN